MVELTAGERVPFPLGRAISCHDILCKINIRPQDRQRQVVLTIEASILNPESKVKESKTIRKKLNGDDDFTLRPDEEAHQNEDYQFDKITLQSNSNITFELEVIDESGSPFLN